jgi:hypothetical protein
VRISRIKLSKPNQKIEEMSTPNAGGSNSRAGCMRGSVGQTIALYGNFLISVFGYHDMIVLAKNNTLMVFMRISRDGFITNKEERTGSVSARTGLATIVVSAAAIMGKRRLDKCKASVHVINTIIRAYFNIMDSLSSVFCAYFDDKTCDPSNH